MALDNICEFRMKLLDTINGLGRLDLIFVVSLALLSIFTTWHCFHFQTNRTVRSQNPRVLQTLSAFVTPTSCASISDQTSLLKKTKSLEFHLIELDLSNLIDFVCTGKVELRDSSDLHDLFRAKLRIYGWHFGLSVNRSWSFKISRWMIAHHTYTFLRVSLKSLSKAVFY